MFKGDELEPEPQKQSYCYKQRIFELQAECEQKQLRHRQLVKKIGQLTKSQEQLQQQLRQYQQQVRSQSTAMQQTLQDRNGCIVMLRSQLTAVEESNENLYNLLKQANSKIVGLMRELTDKNRFIKEYIQKQEQ